MKKIIDLSLIVEEGIDMPFHTGRNEPYQKEVVKTHDSHQVHGTVVEMYLHVGTHIDAPLHFIRGGDSIDQLPLERLVGDAVALDLLHKQGKVQHALLRGAPRTGGKRIGRDGIHTQGWIGQRL